MAIGNINVSTNSKIDNDIEELQNKDNEIVNKIGTTDISGIGDGTLTNAIDRINSTLVQKQNMTGTISTSLNSNVAGSYALCNIMDLGSSLTTTIPTFVEGTFTFINQQWEDGSMAPTYYKYTVDVHFDKHHSSISLFSSNLYGLKPVVLKYINPSDETDIHYYLSLLFTRGWNWNCIYFNGISSHELSKSYIKYSGSTLPDGYTVYQEPLPMRKLNLVSGYIGNDNASYSYEQIKALEDRIAALENK